METVKEENEKKKEYLKQYGKALRQEKRIEEELERLKLDRMLPGALACQKAATFLICRIMQQKWTNRNGNWWNRERKELGSGLKSGKELSRWKTRQRKIS